MKELQNGELQCFCLRDKKKSLLGLFRVPGAFNLLRKSLSLNLSVVIFPSDLVHLSSIRENFSHQSQSPG
jgi:hypothetical protein